MPYLIFQKCSATKNVLFGLALITMENIDLDHELFGLRRGLMNGLSS